MAIEALREQTQRIVDSFNRQIQAASGENAELETVEELTTGRKVCDEAGRLLRDLKSRVIQEERAIAVEFRDATARAAEKSHLGMTLLAGKKSTGGKLRAAAKRDIALRKARALEPYKDLKRAIDDAAGQIRDFKREIAEDLKEARAARSPSPKGGPKAQDLAGQIQRLADLRDQGVLTDSEFEAAKAKLLG